MCHFDQMLFRSNVVSIKCRFGRRRRRRLRCRYPLQVRHKQDWGRGFILLLPQTACRRRLFYSHQRPHTAIRSRWRLVQKRVYQSLVDKRDKAMLPA